MIHIHLNTHRQSDVNKAMQKNRGGKKLSFWDVVRLASIFTLLSDYTRCQRKFNALGIHQRSFILHLFKPEKWMLFALL